jgi:hypothetical protein
MDDYLPTRIRDRATSLLNHLARWRTRLDEATPEQRHSATDAMATIDAMLHSLSTVRAELVREIRRNDDAVAKRVDAYLAKVRE